MVLLLTIDCTGGDAAVFLLFAVVCVFSLSPTDGVAVGTISLIHGTATIGQSTLVVFV